MPRCFWSKLILGNWTTRRKASSLIIFNKWVWGKFWRTEKNSGHDQYKSPKDKSRRMGINE